MHFKTLGVSSFLVLKGNIPVDRIFSGQYKKNKHKLTKKTFGLVFCPPITFCIGQLIHVYFVHIDIKASS